MNQVSVYIIVWALAALVVLLLFALARRSTEREAIETQELIIEELARQKDEQFKYYEELLSEKRKQIKLLEGQVNILNDEVARMHGRPKQSFMGN